MDEMDQEFLAEGLDTIHEGELVIAPNGTALVRQDPMQQIRTRYVTAMAVQTPRNLTLIEKQLCREASLLGERAFYAWTVKDKKTGKTTLISGASIGLAMAAIRCFGNCVVDQDPPVETKEAWFFTVHVIDLEHGFTHTRTGRFSRTAMVYGEYDYEQQERIRYEKGQSISIRNAIEDVVPRWLMEQAIKHAKGGVRKRLEDYITKNGIEKARDILIGRLMEKGVTPERILEKMQRPTLPALTLDDLVIMQGDTKQLEDSAEVAENLYPDVDRTTHAPASPETAEGKTAAPQSRTEEVKQQMTQRRTKADRATRQAPVYASKDQVDDLMQMAHDRGPAAVQALEQMFAHTAPDQVTLGQLQTAKEHLMSRPVVSQLLPDDDGFGSVEYGPDRDVDPLPREDQ